MLLTDAERTNEPEHIDREGLIDFVVRDAGSIVMLSPQTDEGRQWLDENVGKDNGYQPYWPDTVIIEPRYVQDVLDGIVADGLAYDVA